ncbi:hypothetical protein J6590_066897 [Homalodisca vitripennis]|nr:hypothetical protein J6590_066897 [Homalodisca vitripennis]
MMVATGNGSTIFWLDKSVDSLDFCDCVNPLLLSRSGFMLNMRGSGDCIQD